MIRFGATIINSLLSELCASSDSWSGREIFFSLRASTLQPDEPLFILPEGPRLRMGIAALEDSLAMTGSGVNHHLPSYRRKPVSRKLRAWTPAFAGVTVSERLDPGSKPVLVPIRDTGCGIE